MGTGFTFLFFLFLYIIYILDPVNISCLKMGSRILNNNKGEKEVRTQDSWSKCIGNFLISKRLYRPMHIWDQEFISLHSFMTHAYKNKEIKDHYAWVNKWIHKEITWVRSVFYVSHLLILLLHPPYNYYLIRYKRLWDGGCNHKRMMRRWKPVPHTHSCIDQSSKKK